MTNSSLVNATLRGIELTSLSFGFCSHLNAEINCSDFQSSVLPCGHHYHDFSFVVTHGTPCMEPIRDIAALKLTRFRARIFNHLLFHL